MKSLMDTLSLSHKLSLKLSLTLSLSLSNYLFPAECFLFLASVDIKPGTGISSRVISSAMISL